MAKRKSLAGLVVLTIIGMGVIILLHNWGNAQTVDHSKNVQSSQITLESSDKWLSMQSVTPVPFTTPLPEFEWTPIDGTYAKLDPDWPQWWACRRCADYRPAGGNWKLQFDRGVMRIYYEVTGWKSIASYSVSGDRLYLYNDPICPSEVGEYQWRFSHRTLEITVVEDPCSFQLRGDNISKQNWNSCLPPTDIIAGSNHWHKPPGCWDYPLRILPEPPVFLDFRVEVIKGFALDSNNSPDLSVDANAIDRVTPNGISISMSDQGIPYGRSLVLWQEGFWIEASTELSFKSMGIQFYGDHVIGWARVLFDGVEVWRGNTSTIYSHLGRNGGYIKVSGFMPGRHTIRAEWLGMDTRPVTVAYFGFEK